jgi:hypothetical protein
MITSLYLSSTGSAPRLRIAVLVDGPLVPRYVAAILEDIARCDFADVVLAVAVAAPPPSAAERLPGLAHELYVRVDRALGGEQDPLALVDPGLGLCGVDRIEAALPAEGAAWLPEGALAEIRRRAPDVILRFCAPLPRGEVLHAARCGVWSYQFGSEEDALTGTPFFQQLAEDAPTRDVRLEVLEDAPGAGLELCRSSFGCHGNLFLAHYRDVAFWETTHFVVWKLHDLHELGWEHVRARAVPARVAEQESPRPSGRVPSLGEMVRVFAPRLGTAVANRVGGERAVANQWRLALRRGALPFGSSGDVDLSGFRWLETPPGHFWADPFLLARGGQTLLFFEDHDAARGYATIRWAEVRADLTIGPPVTCLDLGYHLSFPFVFEHDGEVFMIPESLADGTVTLYRARSFPTEWVVEKVLFRGNAADTSVCARDGRFYFITTLFERDDRGMKTMLFTADDLTAPWRLHPASPISADVRDARNAGALLRRGDRLFRPTQNCGPSYGYGLNLQEIVAFSPDRYEERPFCAVGPEALPFPAIGVHSYNTAGDLEVIDGCAKLQPRARFSMPAGLARIAPSARR